MRMFRLVRDTDVTGVSGTGTVAQGVKFSDETVAMRWLSKWASTAIYPDMETLVNIHCHDGTTRVIWC